MQSVSLTGWPERGIGLAPSQPSFEWSSNSQKGLAVPEGFTQTHSKQDSPKSRRRKKHEHIIPGKHWPAMFDKPRDASVDFFWGEKLKRIRAEALSEGDAVVNETNTQMRGPTGTATDEDLLDLLVEELEGSIPSWEAKAVRAMFSREANQKGTIPEAESWAWLDDREFSSGCNRASRVLDCPGLRQALRHERFGHDELPDVDRRLIYISKLTPAFIIALAESAGTDEINALRDAVCKHVTLASAFRVFIPMIGFPTFRLEFHLAHLILREESCKPKAGTSKPTSNDLSFLESGNSSGSSPTYKIRQAHISVVLCGWGNTRWTGYAFANTGLDAQPALDHDEDEPNMDYFAADRDDDHVKDADTPIWDAREYWLQIVAIRCRLILKEWVYLRDEDPLKNSNGVMQPVATDIQKTLDITLQSMQLSRKLIDALSMNLRAYERFNLPDGDVSYFSDITDPKISRVRNSIKESFEMMADLHLELTSLDDAWKRRATHLGHMLSLESNRLMAQSNVMTQRSNELNVQSHDIQRQTQALAESTIALNKEIRKLNEESTEAARANQADAAKTSLSTRVNVELLLLTTPFGMVLQYFGSEKDIFSFSRNTKTFVLSTIILMIILRLLAVLLEHSGKLLRLSPWGQPARVGRRTSSVSDQGGSDWSRDTSAIVDCGQRMKFTEDLLFWLYPGLSPLDPGGHAALRFV
ncbi:hypothetical protein HBI23_101520 [Parastagonospora nodorum]|nr:hypothetical protein HBH50_078230 [Parastagonospora nodorum]KAH4093930.1 hypothetical protein HBH48_066480 [Parastagonospora nodorum]KAH5662313.1 hypothetical protein HBI23_101520 [Parastagonospora nodorum]KAH6124274.1 hypothetical protein HBI69_042010 [Parastagonospora nodorum]